MDEATTSTARDAAKEYAKNIFGSDYEKAEYHMAVISCIKAFVAGAEYAAPKPAPPTGAQTTEG